MNEEQGGSAVKSSEGAEVLQEVVRMTGLPEEYLDSALSSLLGTPGESVNSLSLDQLRNLLLECLETLNDQMEAGEDRVS